MTASVFLSLSLGSCASTNIKNIAEQDTHELYADEARLYNRVAEAREKLKKGGFLLKDEVLEDYINKVLHKLVGDFEKEHGVTLHAYILPDPYFNAFCYPDGTIYLHTSILSHLENEAQLATVLAHESVHFMNRHALKAFRSNINKTSFLKTMSVACSGLSGGIFETIFIKGIEGSIYGYERKLEAEADRIGFELVKKAGYDIKQTQKTFEIFYEITKNDKIKTPYFYHKHPSLKWRIREYKKFIKESREKDGEIAGVMRFDEYNKAVRRVFLVNAELDMKRGKVSLAQKQVERYNYFYPDDPKAYCLLGELEAKDGNRHQAAEMFKKAIELDDAYPKSHKCLGMLHYKKGEKELAKAAFKKYLTLNPGALDAEYIRGYLNE